MPAGLVIELHLSFLMANVSDNLDSIGNTQINIVASNDSTLAYLSGRIDIDSSPAVRDGLLGMLQPPSAKIVSVDLSGVTHIDSSGVATLIMKIARGNETELRLQGCFCPHLPERMDGWNKSQYVG
jgi:anti-anti-sigma factor